MNYSKPFQHQKKHLIVSILPYACPRNRSNPTNTEKIEHKEEQNIQSIEIKDVNAHENNDKDEL